MNRLLWVSWLIFVAGCGAASSAPNDGGSPPPGDGGTSDAGETFDAGDGHFDAGVDAGGSALDSGSDFDGGGSDAGSVDAGVVDAGPVDAGPVDAGVCGDGVTAGAELCDGDTVDCTSLGASYSAGQATCRSNCSGYAVSTCTLDPSVKAELVRPAERAPRWADARCNDGTTFDFVVSPAPSPTGEWVIYLQGGGFCDGTYVTCKPGTSGNLRDPTYLSSSSDPADRAALAAVGVTPVLQRTADNPRFRNANLALAYYCSSDLYTGTLTEPVMLEGLSRRFTGRLNAKAMLDVLRQRYGLDDSNPATKILYQGGSAGGNGVRNTVDLLVHSMPNAAQAGRIYLAPEAGFMPLGWSDPNHSIAGSGKTDRAFYQYVAGVWHSQTSAECTAIAKAAGEDGSVCASGLYGDLTALKPMAEGGFGLHVFEYQSRRDAVYGKGLHGLATAADFTPWDALVADDLKKAGVRWLFAPDPMKPYLLHGLVDPKKRYDVYQTSFPPYSAANSPSCDSTPYTTPRSYADMLVDFFDDPNPDTSAQRVCFDGDWP